MACLKSVITNCFKVIFSLFTGTERLYTFLWINNKCRNHLSQIHPDALEQYTSKRITPRQPELSPYYYRYVSIYLHR